MLVALLALALLHGAVSFHAPGLHCQACLALDAPAVAAAGEAPVRPASPPAVLVHAPSVAPLFEAVVRLRPLRAPPSAPNI